MCFASAAAALGFVWYGINMLYDNSYNAQIVGGDAYNFIIYATRGTAFVCGGVVFAVLGAVSSILAVYSGQREAQAKQPISAQPTDQP